MRSPRRTASRVARDGILAAGTAVVLGISLLVVPPSAAGPVTADRPAVIEAETLGRTVKGRPIRAWHLGQERTKDTGRIPRVVLISTMHGDEGATRRLLFALRDGAPIVGVDLWVVPVYNPDGLARGTRRNARGVDLNRNYPRNWAPLKGNYNSGPRPASERETRVMMRFLKEVDPDYVLSFHQPLHGVDVNVKRPKFARKVARHLRLPTTDLDCGGTCHGTMTGWFNARFDGFALTIEYGARPGLRHMRRIAPRRVLRIFGASRVASG